MSVKPSFADAVKNLVNNYLDVALPSYFSTLCPLVGTSGLSLHRESRPTTDDYFLAMAVLVSARGTCVRRRVGCVLVNSHHHVLATGYNGVAAGLPHCLTSPCNGGSTMPSGTGLDACEAIHAEANALLQCRNSQEIETCYCTTAPCIHCVKLLMNTSCKRIVFIDDYPHSSASKRLWMQVNGQWIGTAGDTLA